MHDLKNVVVAERGEHWISHAGCRAHRVAAVGRESYILVCHMDERAVLQIGQERCRTSPASGCAVDVDRIGLRRREDFSVQRIRQVGRIEARRGQ